MARKAYEAQIALLVRVLPLVAKEDVFALTGTRDRRRSNTEQPVRQAESAQEGGRTFSRFGLIVKNNTKAWRLGVSSEPAFRNLNTSRTCGPLPASPKSTISLMHRHAKASHQSVFSMRATAPICDLEKTWGLGHRAAHLSGRPGFWLHLATDQLRTVETQI